jgi:prophage antirepressor-like protein
LNIINPSRVVERLDKDGIFLLEICDLTPVKVTSRARKTQKMIFVDEPNLYRVIFKSDKPEAVAFQNWVFKEVLPQIRKQGYYSLYGQVTPSTQSLVNEVAQATVMQITQALAPITKKPVVVVKAHKNGTAKKVEVSFQVKLSFQIEES